MGSDYPRLMYRPGTEVLGIWGVYDCDLRIVESAADEASALSEGWTLRPDDEHLTAEITDEPKRRGRPPKQRIEE